MARPKNGSLYFGSLQLWTMTPISSLTKRLSEHFLEKEDITSSLFSSRDFSRSRFYVFIWYNWVRLMKKWFELQLSCLKTPVCSSSYKSASIIYFCTHFSLKNSKFTFPELRIMFPKSCCKLRSTLRTVESGDVVKSFPHEWHAWVELKLVQLAGLAGRLSFRF